MTFSRRPGARFSRDRIATGGGGPAPPFSPIDIAGLVLWIDMLDPAAFVEAAGTMVSVTNKVSSVVWDTGTMPAYLATAINSKPGMVFDGSTHLITSTEAAVFAAVQNAHAYTLFLVGSYDATNRTESAFGVGAAAVATDQTRGWGAGSAGKWRSQCVNDAGTSVTVLSSAGSDTNVNKFCWYSPGTTASLSLNGGADDPSDATQDPGTLTPDRAAIGSRPDSTPDQFFKGELGEILLYDSELTAGQLAQVFAYLARWD